MMNIMPAASRSSGVILHIGCIPQFRLIHRRLLPSLGSAHTHLHSTSFAPPPHPHRNQKKAMILGAFSQSEVVVEIPGRIRSRSDKSSCPNRDGRRREGATGSRADEFSVFPSMFI